ncbi:peptidase C39 family protein [Nocardioides sp. Root151]|uniref:peptidase C39 family protein n=1 Tax=Nocardioides sp. Root151 TaxID=1736475 RepID=UPI00070379CD|nr:peptidase C39 family protein [Nocardioides sp. Root151]KQZ75512.1 hypothetical protein ASD66_03955 [Nocardioides sp. Root151]
MVFPSARRTPSRLAVVLLIAAPLAAAAPLATAARPAATAPLAAAQVAAPAAITSSAGTSHASPAVVVQRAGAVTPRVQTTRWSSNAELATGLRNGSLISNGSLQFAARPMGSASLRDPYGSGRSVRYDYARWTSPWVAPGFDATNLIASWNARVPAGTYLRIDARTKSATAASSWDTLAVWGFTVESIHRYSGEAQTDDLNKLNTDTLVSQGTSRMRQWQLRVTLMRRSGTTATPRLDSIGAVAANFTTRTAATSPTSMRATSERAVPKFSQMIHTGHYPQWDAGGEAWCSPTSTAMVLRYYGRGPSPEHYAWTGERDGQVDHAARYTYDHNYQGTGNWPFNTAYAGQYSTDAFVTRLLNLRDAERFIRAGIPVVVSIAFARGGLDGSPLTSTPGHLVVITGFAADGRVIVNDPSAATNAGVRRVYRRDQFERAWLGGSGGVAYVIRPPGRALPGDSPRW